MNGVSFREPLLFVDFQALPVSGSLMTCYPEAIWKVQVLLSVSSGWFPCMIPSPC